MLGAFVKIGIEFKKCWSINWVWLFLYPQTNTKTKPNNCIYDKEPHFIIVSTIVVCRLQSNSFSQFYASFNGGRNDRSSNSILWGQVCLFFAKWPFFCICFHLFEQSLVAFAKMKRQVVQCLPDAKSPKDFTDATVFWFNQLKISGIQTYDSTG